MTEESEPNFEVLEDELEDSHDTFYPTSEDIMGIHADIVEENDDTEEGLFNDGEGKIDFILQQIEEGIMGSAPETIHEKALLLFKRIASNHPFVDGNKRTALNTTWTFYALNGYHFNYGEEIRAILKLFAVKEEMVDEDEVLSYFEDITYDADADRVPTHVAQFVHLTRWYSDLSEKSEDKVEELKEGADREAMESFIDFFSEAYSLTVRLVSFRDEYEDELSEEFIEQVDSEESSMNDFIEFVIDEVIADMSEEEFQDVEGIQSKEEFRKRLELMKPQNFVKQADGL